MGLGIGVLVHGGSGRAALRGRGGCLWTLFCNMSSFSAEKAEVLLKAAVLLVMSWLQEVQCQSSNHMQIPYSSIEMTSDLASYPSSSIRR